MLINYTITDG